MANTAAFDWGLPQLPDGLVLDGQARQTLPQAALCSDCRHRNCLDLRLRAFRHAPFCDGTHKITASEDPGKLYWYDDTGKRHLAADGDGYYIRSDQQTQEA